MRGLKVGLLAGLASMAGWVPAEAATNLIVNGGFEQGFDHWNRWDNQSAMALSGYAKSGEHSAALGPMSIYGYWGLLTQEFVTTPGHSYDVSFALSDFDNSFYRTKHFYVEFDDGFALYVHEPETADGVFGNYSIRGTATKARTTLGFRFLNPGQYLLDDVKAFDVLDTAPGPVPEPATWWSLLFGFGLLGTVLRRSRQQARHRASD